MSDYKFNDVTWSARYPDPEGQPDLFYWEIYYSLELPAGTYQAGYTAEASQLPAEPAESDVKALVLGLFSVTP